MPNNPHSYNQPHYLIIRSLAEHGPALMRESELQQSGPGVDVKAVYRIDAYGPEYILTPVKVKPNTEPRFFIQPVTDKLEKPIEL